MAEQRETWPRRRRWWAPGAWVVLAGLALTGPSVRAADEPATLPAVPEPVEAFQPVAPELPGDVVAALQEGRYDDALQELSKLADAAEAPAASRAYFALITGITHRLAGRLDPAREALATALQAEPQGPWTAKLRGELAAVELAAGRFDEAEALARAQAEALLAPARKDALAGIYRSLAKRLLEPPEPTVAPDPEGAHALLEPARTLAQGAPLRAELLLDMARSSQKAGNHDRAIQEFQRYLDEYPEGEKRPEGVDPAGRDAARFGLAESQLEIGQAIAARLTWENLARDDTAKERSPDLHARALYQIAQTYIAQGNPNPDLVVGALRRFLQAYPSHRLSVKAAFEIGENYTQAGRLGDALAAFRAFLAGEGYQAEGDEAKRDLAELSMTAAFQVGAILQNTRSFDAAIEAFESYLAKYPNGPQSADAQRAILEIRLAIAEDHEAAKRYEQARAAWQQFVTQYPLDGRVPEVLYRIGASFLKEEPKGVDAAIEAWQTLIGKFPGTEPAAHAKFEIARLYETEKADPEEAIERYKQVDVEPWQSQARQRIAVMEQESLAVITPRAFRSGESPILKITTRNLKKLTFTAYKLDAEAYFRKKHALGGVESLDIALVAPDAEWTAEVPGYKDYTPIESEYALKVELPGVHVVKVTDEATLQATTLVVGSDLEAIVKSSRDQVLVFAQDMKTGQGRAGARVLVAAGGEVVLEGKTGEDGVLLHTFEKDSAAHAGGALRYLVLDGPDAAGSGLEIPGMVAQGLSARAYLYTDRPAYRPGQRVELRGVVREVDGGRYSIQPGAAYKLEVTDSRGRPFIARDVNLSEFGTFAESIALDGAAPVGTYAVRLYRPGGSEFSGQFEVQAYQLEKVDLEFDLPRTVFYRGETIKGTVVALYQYGTPLADRPIEVALPDGRILSGKTDAAGRYPFEAKTEDYTEDTTLTIGARLPLDNVAAAARVAVAVQGFGIAIETRRDVFLDDEPFPVDLTTTDALGEPVGQELTVTVLERVEATGPTPEPIPVPVVPAPDPIPPPAPSGFQSMPVQGGGLGGFANPDAITPAVPPDLPRPIDPRRAEREVSRTTVQTDPKTGKATVTLKIDDDEGGRYVIRAQGTDRFGNPVTAERELTISGTKDENRLRILADRTQFKVGEEATVRLHSRLPEGLALLAWEADRILTYRLVSVKEGDNRIQWAVEGDQFPNFTLTAARMHEQQFAEARLDVQVERDLRVTVRPEQEAVEPGEELAVVVEARDQLGNPVAAELSLALVDRALLRLYPDRLPPIGPFFYDQERRGAFETTGSNTFFPYRPPTVPVPSAVVEERLRSDALRSELARRRAATEEAKEGIALDMAMPGGTPAMPAPSAAPALTEADRAAEPQAAGRPALGFNGRMMEGGMGGMGGALFDASPPRYKAEAEQLGQIAAGEYFFADEARKQMADGVMMRRAGVGERGRGLEARQAFVETAYWNPKVVTGEDGLARVTINAPSALSRYEFKARGVTGADTLVGEATADLSVRQDFFVELRTPATLMEGDAPRFQARVHHRGVRGPVEVVLKAYAGEMERTFRKTVEVSADGASEILFEPFEVPDADTVRLDVAARAGGEEGATDALTVEVPVRPWGVQAFATASGSSSDDTTALVTLPPGRDYAEPEMLIVLSPTVQRMLIELALGRDAYPLPRSLEFCLPIPPDTVLDRASNLLGAASALGYLRQVGGAEAPEAERLRARVRGLASELVTLQNDDGGWPWVPGDPQRGRPAPGSDRLTSARAAWALAAADALVALPDPKVLDRAADYLNAQFAQAEAADTDTRAALLHALSLRGRASFESANALNRVRQNLSDAALAYLALTFSNLQRANLAGEVLGVLGPRAKTESAGPGLPVRRYWEGATPNRASGGTVEATALAALAYAQARPEDDLLDGAVEWLLAHRVGTGWRPAKADGPALAALSRFYGQAKPGEDRYRLVVTVNDQEVYRKDVQGDVAGEAIAVPRAALKIQGENRVRFDLEGRGTFGYAVTLTGFTRDFGPDQDRANRQFLVTQHLIMPAAPEFEGRPLPTGFGVAVNAQTFENRATQVEPGGRVRVRINAGRFVPTGQPAWERDFLVLQSNLPAGTTLVDGSVQTSAAYFEQADGVLTFYFAPDQHPSQTHYEVYGYLPGRYRVLPPRLWSAYDPARRHMAADGVFDLQVLAPGEPKTDDYKPTPDELFARGKALFDAGRLAEAAEPLQALWDGYTLKDDTAKEAARMLLFASIEAYQPARIVQFFEVLKEKYPDLVIAFDKVLIVGRAYRDIGEHERAYLVWRGIAEASYLEDARLGELLRQRNRPLEAVALLLDLWRAYPNTESIQADIFGLSQVLASLATTALDDAELRRALAGVEKSRSDLLLQAIRLVQVFLAQAPRSPLADEASLALVGNFLELEDYDSVVRLSERFAALYPKSTYLDSFQYSEALGRFHLGQYDEAIQVAETIAEATYKDAEGVERPSPNKWQALYILGQIHDARRQAEQAVNFYRRVADRFTDAAEAVATLTGKELSLPEVTVLRPPAAPEVAAGAPEPAAGLRNIAVAPVDDDDDPADEAQSSGVKVDEKVTLTYRNIAEADVTVYPVDLLRLYLTRRNLDGIAGIDLAGITPLLQKTIPLQKGLSYEEQTATLDLPLPKEGAYLVMVRGEDLYASGIVLVSPLEMQVREEADGGRVRVRITEARSGAPVAGVAVRVIGSVEGTFHSGETDLRGVFTAEGVTGAVTALARQDAPGRPDAPRYAFHRGTTYLGSPPAPDSGVAPAPPGAPAPAEQPGQATLEDNLRSLNTTNQMQQLQRLQERFQSAPAESGAGVGGFK